MADFIDKLDDDPVGPGLEKFGDVEKQNKDWLFRMEVMQVARLALYNWMRRKLEQEVDE